MADPRSFLLPFAAIAIATGIATLDQTSASLFPSSLQPPPIVFDDDDHDAYDLATALTDAERAAGIEATDGFEEMGQASWYGSWHHGRKTANGERFDMNELTAAHRSLPLGTNVRVTNLENGRSIEVRINDRGPYVGARVIDLSRQAARELRMEKEGLAPVLIEELPKDETVAANRQEAAAGAPN